MASRPVPSCGVAGLGSHPLTEQSWSHRKGQAFCTQGNKSDSPKVREQAPGTAERGARLSDRAPAFLQCTVLHCVGARRALQVLTSHLEALAMLPSHRASFPEPFYCPKWRGG